LNLKAQADKLKQDIQSKEEYIWKLEKDVNEVNEIVTQSNQVHLAELSTKEQEIL
jgi:uncharacterized protein YoxC